jgi:hypothetical protein
VNAEDAVDSNLSEVVLAADFEIVNTTKNAVTKIETGTKTKTKTETETAVETVVMKHARSRRVPTDARTLTNATSLHHLKKKKTKKFDIRLAPYSVLTVERDYIETYRRYENLYISNDFTKTIASWVREIPIGEFPINRFVPFACDNETREKIDSLSPSVQSSASLTATVGSIDSNNVRWFAKVVLVSGHPAHYLDPKDTRDVIDAKDKESALDLGIETRPNAPLTQQIKFVVQKKDRSKLLLLGGEWDPQQDGEDPHAPTTLINTAIRHVYDAICIDLRPCTRWWKFLEIHYDRRTHREVCVIFIPSVWDIRPSREEFLQQWEKRELLKQRREREEKATKDKPEIDKPRESEVNDSKSFSTKSENEVKPDVTKAPKTCFVYALTKRDPNMNIKSSVLSLDGLLDYDYEEDRWEPTFEVSVFAENFFEMLQRDFGHLILRALENYAHKERSSRPQHDTSPTKNDKKRSRDDSSVENISSTKKFKSDSERKTESVPRESDNEQTKRTEISDENAKSNKQARKSADTRKGKGHDKEKSKDSESEQEKSSSTASTPKTLPDTSLLRAFQFFDRSRVGYLRSDDVETLIHSLGLGLSKRYVTELIDKVVDSSAHPHRIYYKHLIDVAPNVSSAAKKSYDDDNDNISNNAGVKDKESQTEGAKTEGIKEESVCLQETMTTEMPTSTPTPLSPSSSSLFTVPLSAECPDAEMPSESKDDGNVDFLQQAVDTQPTDSVVLLETESQSPTKDTKGDTEETLSKTT